MRLLPRSATSRRPCGSMHQPMRRVELARARPLLAPLLDELPVLVELDDARVGVAAVAVGDEDSPFGATRTSDGWLNVSGPLPATPALPSVISTRPVGLNLKTCCPFPSLPWPSVTQMLSSAVDEDAMRVDEHAGAEARHELAPTHRTSATARRSIRRRSRRRSARTPTPTCRRDRCRCRRSGPSSGRPEAGRSSRSCMDWESRWTPAWPPGPCVRNVRDRERRYQRRTRRPMKFDDVPIACAPPRQ